MRTSEQVDKIAAALLAFQKGVTPPPKEQTNPFFKSKYCDLPSLLGHCKDLLTKNGLVFVSVGLTSRIMHQSGQWIEGDFAISTSAMTAQQVGAAESYGRRYGLQGLLGICAEDDDDGNSASQPAAKNYTLKPPPAQKPVEPIQGSGPYHPAAPKAPPAKTPPQADREAFDEDSMIQATVLATSKQRNDSGSYGILIRDGDHQPTCSKDDKNKIKCNCGAERWLNTWHDTPWNAAKALKGKVGIFTLTEPNEKGYRDVEHLVGVQ